MLRVLQPKRNRGGAILPASGLEREPDPNETGDQRQAEGQADGRASSVGVRAAQRRGSRGLGTGIGRSRGGDLLGSRSGQGGGGQHVLFTDLTVPDHDVLSVRRDAIDDQEQHGRPRGEEGGVGGHLGDVQGRRPGLLVDLVRGDELEESLTELDGVGGETSSDDVDLGRLDDGLVGRVQGHAPVVTTISQGLGESGVTGPLLVVPAGVPPLDRVGSPPLGVGDVGVGVGSRDQQASILEEDDGRVVQPLLGRGSQVPVPLLTGGGVGIVETGLVERLVRVRLTGTPTLVSVSGGTHVSTVTHPKLTVGEVDKLSHGPPGGQEIVILVLGVGSVGRDPDTRVVGGDGGNVVLDPTVRTPVGRSATSAEEQRGLVVVGRGQGQHGRRGRGGVDPDGVGHVGQVGGLLGVPVVQDGAVVGLHEELA